jgi:hypothetical protein
MQRREEPLTHLVVKDGTNNLERAVRVAHTITMGQEELMTVDLGGLGLFVQHHATPLFQILVSPNVMVARKEMHLDTHVRQLRQFS